MTRLTGLLFIFAGACSYSTEAHSLFTNLYVNNVNQGDGTCIRVPQNPSTATYPITDLQDTAMVCGFDGTTPVKRVCSVPKASQLGFEYRMFPDGSAPGSVEPSHKGPCAVYLKAVPSASETSGEGEGWFKIWDEGFDTNAGKWCSDKIIDNNGILNVNLPPDLAGGNYLVRSELLALQEADKTPPQPQFYIGCAQIYLDSDERSGPSPESTVAVPGHVKISDPSVRFNIYLPKWPYSTPGPASYKTGIPISQSMSSRNHVEGLLPAKTIAVNGNWWGTEQESYDNEGACWDATNNCYNQLKSCYDTATATGSKGCRAYEKKCTTMQSGCKSGNYNGPPNKGQILTAGVKGNIKSLDSTTDNLSAAGPTNSILNRRTPRRRHWK